MKAIEQRIHAVLAEKSAMESKLVRMEANYKAEIDKLVAVSECGGSDEVCMPGGSPQGCEWRELCVWCWWRRLGGRCWAVGAGGQPSGEATPQ